MREVLSKEFYKKNKILPYKEDENYVYIYAPEPPLPEVLAYLELKFQKAIKVNLIDKSKFEKLILEEVLNQEVEIEEEEREDKDVSGPIVELINDILNLAISHKASDIHFEPFEKFMRVRIRVDGVLHTIKKIPKEDISSVITRLKIMAKLDIAQKRLPQDGKILYQKDGKKIDIRVSILPTVFGERAVLRLLYKNEGVLSFKELLIPSHLEEKVKKIIKSPYGMILNTGPTGSGKTTTLYAFLNEIKGEDKNIITVEDPVEYQIEGINQVEVKSEIGFTFEKALRSILRQDPDVIMIGEIRDKESAKIAVRASITGHLVLSTLHTNTALEVIPRLKDLEIEPYMISSAMLLSIAQRLVRRLCPYCKEKYEPSFEELSLIFGKEKAKELKNKKIKLFKAKGCEKCLNTGYMGRVAVYEFLFFDDKIKHMITQDISIEDIKKYALEKKLYYPLILDIQEKILKGITDIEECKKVV